MQIILQMKKDNKMAGEIKTPLYTDGFIENLNLVAKHIRQVDDSIFKDVSAYVELARKWAIASDEPDPVLYPGEQSSKTNAGYSATSASESLSSAAAAALSEDASASSALAASNSAGLALISETNAEASYQASLLVEADVTAEGDAQILLVQTEGTTQVGNVQTEGAIQIGLCEDQVDLAEAQVVLATAEASTATAQAVIATDAADEIKDVGVADPVTSVPLLPGNVPGTPTVSYDPVTGLFTYGIPVGKTGETAAVVTPQGAASVAELNALVSDPGIGFAWWMTDSGTITYGDPDTTVVSNDIVVWVAEGYFFNAGQMESGSTWPGVTDVTVEGLAPAIGDDLARHGTSYTKAEQDSTDGIQDTAISLNTAKTSYTDATIVAQNTLDAAAAQSTADGAVSINVSQQTAIDLNTAKVGVTTEVKSAPVSAGAAILNMYSCTQEEYNALTPVATTLYVIVG
ncbi:MAG: hypothetical protein DRH37_07410 [Deltaproteobacteria bacterium]|nr:MAG: hypothetical protein DRH37_07410 [Deltaproteobacteria bacterium]